jgi:hypothetical protein
VRKTLTKPAAQRTELLADAMAVLFIGQFLIEFKAVRVILPAWIF